MAEQAEALAKRSRALWARGLTMGTCGNASVRVAGDAMLIKGTGVCMGEMTADDAVLVSLDGDVLDGRHEPSCEMGWHLGIYRHRADVGAVIHAHPPYATAWALKNRVPPAWEAAGELLGDLALVQRARPGSPELAALVTAAFRPLGVSAALLRDHGTVTVASDLSSAFHLADRLEGVAKVAALAAAMPDRASTTSASTSAMRDTGP